MELLAEVRVGESVSGVSVVSLLGEHDMASADEVRAALQSGLEGSDGMVVDLSQTLFIDSSVKITTIGIESFRKHGYPKVLGGQPAPRRSGTLTELFPNM